MFRSKSFSHLSYNDIPLELRPPKPEGKVRLQKLMGTYLNNTNDSIERQISDHLEYTLARSSSNIDTFGVYQAVAYSVRDRLIELWNDSQTHFTTNDKKRIYYLSIEYLMGRSLQNAIINLGLQNNYVNAVNHIGYALEDVYEMEQDAALGNGGLGRLAACFLDSLATQNFPAWGYGIRYTYGMFKQSVHEGHQIELPDFWLTRGNPWEIERNDVSYPIQFYGHIHRVTSPNGEIKYRWEGGEQVIAVAYDTPIPGFETRNTCNIRLWSSRPFCEFDLAHFNMGDYFQAVEDKQKTENITSILYPNDSTTAGKELRLKQQYFFVSATLQDIVRRIKKKKGRSLVELPELAAIQLNDTHPTIAIAELMRILVDIEEISWNQAWDIVVRTFAFTNHTVMPEALENWDVELFERLLPRHLQIIYDINWHFMNLVKEKFPGDEAKLGRLSIIQEGPVKKIRMAHLAIIGSHCVNGVAKIHSEIIKETIFKDFYELWPIKFQNKTNGVTPRRWMLAANPGLSDLITKYLGSNSWLTNLSLLRNVAKFANDAEFLSEFARIKHQNKVRLSGIVQQLTGIELNPEALFDVQVKRIHEYKRQLLNALYVIHRYITIKRLTFEERKKYVKRAIIFAGKAAPGYLNAKLIIKLINSIAEVVNNDKSIGDLLKVVFLPNYNVSLCEKIVPANNISQHISTAGTEASGTSCMKFVMNGGLIIGTMDGANVEIREEIGSENIFIFGATSEQVAGLRQKSNPLDEALFDVLTTLQSGLFGSYSLFEPVLANLSSGSDYYLVAADFRSYIEVQKTIDITYTKSDVWNNMCVKAVSGMGKFSSDRTIHEYAKDIWGVEPTIVPQPTEVVYQ
eukprot:TRINITY_DN475_c0_g1_i1.p1 TRINITY_DN475_c0_g1~~TRINITY_DN475_c0_g1_i1.p1  ORF type:complete len:855 (-),score=388.61 TRINITY_DN475_c0_g1_i1:121-2685(-)